MVAQYQAISLHYGPLNCVPLPMAFPHQDDSLQPADHQQQLSSSVENPTGSSLAQFPQQPGVGVIPQSQQHFHVAMQPVQGQTNVVGVENRPQLPPSTMFMYGHPGSYLGSSQIMGGSHRYGVPSSPPSVPMHHVTLSSGVAYGAQQLGSVQPPMSQTVASQFPNVPREHLILQQQQPQHQLQQQQHQLQQQQHQLQQQQQQWSHFARQQHLPHQQNLTQVHERIACLEQQLEEEKKIAADIEMQQRTHQLFQFQQLQQQHPAPQGVPPMSYMPGPLYSQPLTGYSVQVQGGTFAGQPTHFPSPAQPPGPYPYSQVETTAPSVPEVFQQVTVGQSSAYEENDESGSLASGDQIDTAVGPFQKALQYCPMPVAQDAQAFIPAAENPAYQLRQDAREFIPSQGPVEQQPRRQPFHQQHRQAHKHYPKYDRQPFSQLSPRRAGSDQLKTVKQQLHDYSLKAMAPASKPEQALEHILTSVVRVPATSFNEQKLEDKPEGHKVLLIPQSPAIRGQEALARVCFALEQILRQMSIGATIISDYKFKESYMRHAPQEVLKVLTCPEEEGSHDILMIGPDIGIICVQVTCIEASTNSGTVKKQVRETLKQLEKDVKVIKQVLIDLDLDDRCVRKVMALPNITSQELKQKLDPSFVKILASTLDTDDGLDELLTLDRLPCVGHRHWVSKESRDELLAWLDRLRERRLNVSLDNYMQIVARYTCSWSVVEVWGVTKPRRQIRSLAQAVAETANRHQLPVLTTDEDNLLRSGESHVVIEAPAGTGVTELLQVRARMELQNGSNVLLFIPKLLTGLREKYEHFALNDSQYTGNVYFWSTEDGGKRKGKSVIRFKSVTGDTATLSSLRGKKNMFALFDRVNRDTDLNHLLKEVTNTASSVWAVKDVATEITLPEGKYKVMHLSTMTRVPSSIQALIKYGLQQASARTQPAGASAANPKGMSLSLPKDHQNVAEVSSYVGLPTDGPSPMFIWHPEGPSTKCTMLQCKLCMSLLRTALVELLGDLALKSIGDEESTQEKSVAHEELQFVPQPATRDHTARKSPAMVGEEEAQTVGAEGLDIYSGNVPPPLTITDVVIFVDSIEDVEVIVKMLNLVNMEKIVQPLAHLPSLIGTEKAVVVYVGRLNLSATDKVLHTLVLQLGDVMTLCQGQLILTLEIRSGMGQGVKQSSPDVGKPGPYELEIAAMLDQAENQHSQQWVKKNPKLKKP